MQKINLFHELQRIEFERRFDPVKIAVFVFIFGLLVLGVLYLVRYQGYEPSREMVETLQKELVQNTAKNKQAELKLKSLPQYQKEWSYLKKRAEEKNLKSKVLEVFKNTIPTNLFVKKLFVSRQVVSEQVPGPKNKKGQPTFVVKVSSFYILSFEATYSEPTKPKSLEARDKLIELLKKSETLKEIAAQITKDSVSENKLKLASFSTTEPVGAEPSVATLALEVELK